MLKTLEKGQRIKISDFCKSNKFTLKIQINNINNIGYDISCFGSDTQGKCINDKYMIFYNQLSSPCQSITLINNSNNSVSFNINLDTLPDYIHNLVFTATVDGNDYMSGITEGYISLIQNNITQFTYKFKGNEFKKEKSLIIAEIYFKNDWKFSTKGFGFNGGLSALLEYFGIEEDTDNILIENEFKRLLKEYLSDDILTSQEMNQLQLFCNKNNINLQTYLDKCKNEIEDFLRRMVAKIISDGVITYDEEKAISNTFNFFNTSQEIKKEISQTLKRAKKIDEIQKGNIEPIQHNITGIKIDEFVWYLESNVKAIRETKNKNSYLGEVIVTSNRVIFKSYTFSTEILIKNILDLEFDSSNIFIMSKVNLHLISGDARILGSYIEQSINKYNRKINLKQTAGKSRTISQEVKQKVWNRDKGQCIECKSTQYLEFDHIIPFSLGGSNSAQNIQLLCRKCNLKKSDRI